MSKFNVTKIEGKNIYKINWENDPMDERVYKSISQYVLNSTNYSAMEGQRRAAFKSFLAETDKTYGTKTSIGAAISVRNIILKGKIIKNYSRMNNTIEIIRKKYDKGMNILELSMKYDFPPLNLLRGILINKGIDATKIYNIFANKISPDRILDRRDLQQYYLAEKNDAESTFNQDKVAKIAAENETAVIDFFRSLGFRIKTQDDLVDEQTNKYGRAILTPDLLFLDEVYINGARVHWIDYKDYIGTRVSFLLTSNINQAAKYNEEWGPGAFCYHHAFVNGLVIPSAELLDARSLGVKLKLYND